MPLQVKSKSISMQNNSLKWKPINKSVLNDTAWKTEKTFSTERL
jgi:hypothetical protein